MWYFDAIIVSDLHLGARNFRATDFLKFLAAVRTDRLIINGDLFDRPYFQGLRTTHIEVLSVLRKMSLRTEVTYVRGNHDPSELWMSGLAGFNMVDETELYVAGRHYLVCHGHQWDEALELPKLIISSADAFYRTCQWIDPSHTLARQLKKRSKNYLGVVEKLHRAACIAALERNYDGIALGHTHLPGQSFNKEIHYLNSGCWTERPATFLGIRNNTIQPYEWNSKVQPLLERKVNMESEWKALPQISEVAIQPETVA